MDLNQYILFVILILQASQQSAIVQKSAGPLTMNASPPLRISKFRSVWATAVFVQPVEMQRGASVC